MACLSAHLDTQMKAKLLGGILLIVGTTIGAGMLALPIATASLGFTYSTALLVFCWFIMTASAFLTLEVNLWLPANSNLISMAKATLGKKGQIVAWMTYLLLLYSLLSAYIAGGADFLKTLLALINVTLPNWSTAILFTLFLGYIVFRGIRSVDIVNRILMATKLSALLLLLLCIFPHVSLTKLAEGEFTQLHSSLIVIITSFGFAVIVPSLRSYFQGDIKQLRCAILIGSLIPLICYTLWNLAIMGVVSRQGDHGLIAMMQSSRPTSDLTNAITNIMQRETITSFARLFTSICVFTSFLGVALCLSDFLLDGLRLQEGRKNNFLIQAATLLPPLLIVLIYPGAFIIALQYAGIYCLILLIILPSLMAWQGRYKKNMANHYRVAGGKLLIIFLLATSVVILIQSLFSIISHLFK